MKDKQTKEFYEFAEFRLDAEKRRLWKNDELIALTPKEFDVLLALMIRAGAVIEKEELLDAVWKEVYVEEATLTRNVSFLRKKLGAGNESSEQIIETVPKRGYRFLPEVTKSFGENALVIEEQTRTAIRIEETISVTDVGEEGNGRRGVEEWMRRGVEEKKIAALPNGSPSPSLFHSHSPLLLFGVLALAVIGFIVYQNYFRQPETRAILASRITPFSGAAGHENTPAFSPDGKQIAFAWNGGEGENLDIYVRLINAVEPLRLTDSEFKERYPAFSPDGANIAFVREFKTHGEVILIPALGGAERRVARLFSGNYSISFAPDGQSIAVVDTADSNGGKQHRIYSINLPTGERRRLTTEAEFVGETTPRFAPDGKSLAFVRVAGSRISDLFVVAAAGGAPRQITFDRAEIHSLAWSASGAEIFFVSYRGGNKANVWRVAAGGGQPELVSISGSEITNIAASPDGVTFAFVENTQTMDIWRQAANESSPKRFAASSHSESNPHFSPDDSRVAFESNRTGKYEIWLADADGKNLRQITDSPLNASSPCFSPDGSQVAFSASSVAFNNLFIVSAEGGAPRRLTETAANDGSPAWSADGKWIYFASNRAGEMNIWKTPADGRGEAVQITRDGGHQPLPAPDGKTIFYLKGDYSETENPIVRRVPADGGAEESAPEFTAANFNGGWAMTRLGIYFLAIYPDKLLTLKFYDFADRQIKDVPGDYKIPDRDYGRLGATADGSRFLYTQFDQNASSIMLAEIK